MFFCILSEFYTWIQCILVIYTSHILPSMFQDSCFLYLLPRWWNCGRWVLFRRLYTSIIRGDVFPCPFLLLFCSSSTQPCYELLWSTMVFFCHGGLKSLKPWSKELFLHWNTGRHEASESSGKDPESLKCAFIRELAIWEDSGWLEQICPSSHSQPVHFIGRGDKESPLF